MAEPTVIYKHPFGSDVEIEVPEGEVRLVAVQYVYDETPTVWVEHRLSVAPEEKMLLTLVGTGHPINEPGLEHVGSTVCANGHLVWHVFRSPRVQT